jgi:hypothetical protein
MFLRVAFVPFAIMLYFTTPIFLVATSYTLVSRLDSSCSCFPFPVISSTNLYCFLPILIIIVSYLFFPTIV